jgi:hypothetical protein
MAFVLETLGLSYKQFTSKKVCHMGEESMLKVVIMSRVY